MGKYVMSAKYVHPINFPTHYVCNPCTRSQQQQGQPWLSKQVSTDLELSVRNLQVIIQLYSGCRNTIYILTARCAKL